MNIVDSPNSRQMLTKSLDYLWEKQKVITDNIANSETPGFKAKYVTFEDELRRNLQPLQRYKLDAKHGLRVKKAIDNTEMRIHNTTNETMRLDGNNVNIDAENVELARAQLQYNTLIEMILRDQRLSTVISGR